MDQGMGFPPWLERNLLMNVKGRAPEDSRPAAGFGTIGATEKLA
jgi:hypothetical protein